MSKDRLLVYIKEMSQAEKRYFKQTLRQYSNNSQFTNYARLFDYLTKIDELDKKQLLKKCTFISPSQLQNIKVRLYNKLLQSNRSYYSSNNENIGIHQYLIDYEILKKKRLYDQCFSVLVKAEKRANHTGAYTLLRQILEYQKYLLEVRLKGKKNKQLLGEVLGKMESLAELSFNMISLNRLGIDIYNVFKLEGRIVRDETILDEIIQDFKEIQSKEERFTLNNHWRISFNYSASLLYRMVGNMQLSEQYLLAIFKVFESDKKLIHTFSTFYFKSLNLSAILYNSMKDSEKALQAIESMRANSSLIENDKDLALTVFENANFQELEVYLQARQFDKAVKVSEKIINQLDVYKSDIHNVNEFSKYYRITLAYFGNHQFKIALKWINRILNFDELRYRKDILSSVQMLNLMIHYELRNYDLVLNKINSTVKYLKRIDRYLPFERIFLRGLRKLASTSSKQKIIKQFVAELNENRVVDKLELYAMQYFDPVEWLNAKVIRA